MAKKTIKYIFTFSLFYASRLCGFASQKIKSRKDAKTQSLIDLNLANPMISIQKICCRLGIAGRLMFLRKQ
jgi:hypothetical protein